jgi:hypothetical protein
MTEVGAEKEVCNKEEFVQNKVWEEVIWQFQQQLQT